jgi:hypothetical protein
MKNRQSHKLFQIHNKEIEDIIDQNDSGNKESLKRSIKESFRNFYESSNRHLDQKINIISWLNRGIKKIAVPIIILLTILIGLTTYLYFYFNNEVRQTRLIISGLTQADIKETDIDYSQIIGEYTGYVNVNGNKVQCVGFVNRTKTDAKSLEIMINLFNGDKYQIITEIDTALNQIVLNELGRGKIFIRNNKIVLQSIENNWLLENFNEYQSLVNDNLVSIDQPVSKYYLSDETPTQTTKKTVSQSSKINEFKKKYGNKEFKNCEEFFKFGYEWSDIVIETIGLINSGDNNAKNDLKLLDDYMKNYYNQIEKFKKECPEDYNNFQREIDLRLENI